MGNVHQQVGAGGQMNVLSIALAGVGALLLVVGLLLLLKKLRASDSDTDKPPTIQGPFGITVTGPVGLVLVLIGVLCIAFSPITNKLASSSNGTEPSASPTVSDTSSSPTSTPSSSSPSGSSPPSGTIADPPSGSNNVFAHVNLPMSGTAQGIPSGYRLDLFLQFVGSTRYYAAADPNTAISLQSNGHWTGAIYIGDAKPIVIWLVSLSPADVKWINAPSQIPDRTNGYPDLRGTVLAYAKYTAK